MLTFSNYEYEAETSRIRADLGSDLPRAHFAAEGDVSLAVDVARRALVQITIPAPRLGRLTVERLQVGVQSLLGTAVILERPGNYAVAEKVGIHFINGFFENGMPSGMSNYFGPLILEELIPPTDEMR